MENKNNYSLGLIFFRFRNSPFYSFTFFATVVVVSIALLFFLVTPRYQQLLIDQQEIKEIQERISVLKKNKTFIESLDKNLLQSNYEVVTKALPPDKDYAGVLNSISTAVIESSVALQDYEFNVGPLASKAGTLTNVDEITLRLNVVADAKSIQKFLEIMNQTLPLVSEVSAKTSELDNRVTEVEIMFHSKDLPLITIDAKKSMQPLSNTDNNLLKMLDEWRVTSESIGTIDLVDATSSGNVKPF